jgi:hypothetical protein
LPAEQRTVATGDDAAVRVAYRPFHHAVVSSIHDVEFTSRIEIGAAEAGRAAEPIRANPKPEAFKPLISPDRLAAVPARDDRTNGVGGAATGPSDNAVIVRVDDVNRASRADPNPVRSRELLRSAPRRVAASDDDGRGPGVPHDAVVPSVRDVNRRTEQRDASRIRHAVQLVGRRVVRARH